jgi:hypothetical protein
VEELIKSIKAYLYERSTSPLLGSFVLAWFVWNYRFMLIVFSDSMVDVKFGAIDRLFEVPDALMFGYRIPIPGEIVHGLVAPAVLSAFYLYGYPLLAKPVYAYSLARQKELREAKQAVENERLLSVKDSRALYQKVAQLELALDQESETYRKEVANLSSVIAELEAKLAASKHEAPSGELLGLDVNELQRAIEVLKVKEFGLEDLFRPEEWRGASAAAKQEAGKKFRKMVEGGAFRQVEIKGKDAGNAMVYRKAERAGLGEKDEEFLAQFESLEEGHGLTASGLQKSLQWHIDEVRALAEDLVLKGYLYNVRTADERTLYMLTHLGRKYLVDNQLLGGKAGPEHRQKNYQDTHR